MNLPIEQVSELAMARFNLTRLMMSPARDASVMLPDPKWIIEEFSPYLEKEASKLPKYAASKWDCDEYMFWAMTQASLCRADNVSAEESGHSVFGVYITGTPEMTLNGVYFHPTANEHACLAILDNTLEWHFMEPQNGKHCYASRCLVTAFNPNLPVAGVDYLFR